MIAQPIRPFASSASSWAIPGLRPTLGKIRGAPPIARVVPENVLDRATSIATSLCTGISEEALNQEVLERKGTTGREPAVAASLTTDLPEDEFPFWSTRESSFGFTG
jgi:hypothetical protein